MPISHEKRCIFVHIPKTAGYSITQAFLRSDVAFDFTAVGLWDRLRGNPQMAAIVRDLKEIYPLNTIAGSAEQHLPARVLRDVVDPNVWDGYFKFAFVRNPWDLVVSTYYYLKAALEHDHVRSVDPDYAAIMSSFSFDEFVRGYAMINADMTASIADRSGRVIVDFVGRVESIDRDFQEVCRRVGVDASLLHENAIPHRSYRECYSQETRDIVARHFARDIERFGYRF